MGGAELTQIATVAVGGSIAASLEAIVKAVLEREGVDLFLGTIVGTDSKLEGSDSLYFNHAF